MKKTSDKPTSSSFTKIVSRVGCGVEKGDQLGEGMRPGACIGPEWSKVRTLQ